MDTFNLQIISADFSKKIMVEWVEIESPTGSFLVGPDHSPLVSIVKPKSIITYKDENGNEQVEEAPGGFFKIKDNEAILLLDR